MMLPAFGAITVTILMAYPVNLYPCRYTLDVMVFGRWGPRRKWARHVGLTVLIAGLGLLIALYVPGVNVVFSLLGSTSSAFVCFILPAAFGVKMGLPEAKGTAGALKCAARPRPRHHPSFTHTPLRSLALPAGAAPSSSPAWSSEPSPPRPRSSGCSASSRRRRRLRARDTTFEYIMSETARPHRWATCSEYS